MVQLENTGVHQYYPDGIVHDQLSFETKWEKILPYQMNANDLSVYSIQKNQSVLSWKLVRLKWMLHMFWHVRQSHLWSTAV